MSKFVALSSDKKALLDALLKFTDSELRVFMRFAALYRAEATAGVCGDFARFVEERNTGLPISELADFCDKIEKEVLERGDSV